MSFGQSSGLSCLGKLRKLQQGKFLRTSWSSICQEGLSTTDLGFKLWDWPLEVLSSPVLSEPMKVPTARWEFAQYIVRPSHLSTQPQSGPLSIRRRNWWWNWGSVTETRLFTKDGQNIVALNPAEILQQKPTSLLTVFRLLAANCQMKNIPRGVSS